MPVSKNNSNAITEIQLEYFDLLKSCKLAQQIGGISEAGISLPKDIFTETSHITLQTTKGWQPAPVSWVEEVFEKIFLFWEKNNLNLYNLLKESPAQYIQVEPMKVESSIRKYGCFFNGILLPDQILLSFVEHKGNGPLTDWRSLTINAIRNIAVYLNYEKIFCPESGPPRLILVPTKREFDQEYKNHTSQSTTDLTFAFLSELSGREICHPKEFMYHLKEKGTESLNPTLLKAIYYRDHSDSFEHYFKSFHQQVISEQGAPGIVRHEPTELLLILDIGARISELERCHSDSYLMGQESVIQNNDMNCH
jgi:hypothetical protein